jgi:CheY-like chemotaxis protein
MSSNKPRILCLEDDRSFIEFYVDRLAEEYEIISATSLPEAERLLDTENLRLALIDLSLVPNDAKDTGGFEFLKRLQALGLGPDLPTIVVTAYETPASMRKAFKDFGVVDFLSKQELDPSGLEKTIAGAIAATYPTRVMGEAPRALVVEDEPDWRETLKELLESEGCQVEVASTYREASDKITSSSYHLATIDLRLSNLDPTDVRGLDLLDMAKRIGLSVDSIVVSAVATPAQIAWALRELGARDFMDKSEFRRERFRRRVRSLLSSLIYVNVTVGTGIDMPVLKLGEEQPLVVSVSRILPKKGVSRSLKRPVIAGRFEMEVVMHPYDVDVLPGSTQFLTVMPDDSAEPIIFKIIPAVKGRIELIVDFLYRSNMLARMSIPKEVSEG